MKLIGSGHTKPVSSGAVFAKLNPKSRVIWCSLCWTLIRESSLAHFLQRTLCDDPVHRIIVLGLAFFDSSDSRFFWRADNQFFSNLI